MTWLALSSRSFFFFQAEDGIRDWSVTGVQTCALPIIPIRMFPDNGDRLRLASVEIPRNKGERRMKIMFSHFSKERLEIKMTIRLPQPNVVDSKICVVCRGMPTGFAGRVAYKDHRWEQL